MSHFLDRLSYFSQPRESFSGDHGVTKTPGTPFMGITIVDHGLQLLPGQTVDTYRQYDNVPLMQRGVVYVLASAAVADGEQMYVTPAGLFTNVAAGNTILAGWVFDQTKASGAIVRVSNTR